MGKKKTFYLSDDNIILIDQLKMLRHFKNMNEVLDYLFDCEAELSSYKREESKMPAMILKNTEILLEIVSYGADKMNNIPRESYKDGFIASYAEAEKLYEANKNKIK